MDFALVFIETVLFVIISVFQLSKFSFSNCQSFPFQNLKNSLFKPSKFSFCFFKTVFQTGWQLNKFGEDCCRGMNSVSLEPVLFLWHPCKIHASQTPNPNHPTITTKKKIFAR
jgi:hypothetical protein